MSWNDLVVRDLSEGDFPAWSELVAASPEGSPYALPEYLETLCRSTGGTFRIRAVIKGEEIVGGIGLYMEKRRSGTVVSPRLLLYYNGPVLRAYDTRYPSDRTRRHVRILRALEASLRTDGFARLALKPRNPLGDVRIFDRNGWTARPGYTYVVPLADLEALEQRYDRNVRRLVNRARREGIELSIDEDFDAFYRFHRETHERKGAPLYLREAAFARYFRELRGKGLVELYHARLPDGRSAAAQLVLLGPHPVTHTVCAAADEELQNTGANPFLRCAAFEDLSRRGYEANDLTDASLNPVTDFKAQLGGDLEAHFEVSRSTPRFRADRAVDRSIRRARGRLAGGLRQLGLLS
jgi:hypothetical protein